MQEQLEDLANAIKQSKKPLVIVGGGVKYSEAGEAALIASSLDAWKSDAFSVIIFLSAYSDFDAVVKSVNLVPIANIRSQSFARVFALLLPPVPRPCRNNLKTWHTR